jgi:fumarate hydratase subunit beta
MKEVIRIQTPLTDEKVEKLKIGDKVLVSGIIYTGRDAAHIGPTPPQPGKVIGSAGPTSSYGWIPMRPS